MTQQAITSKNAPAPVGPYSPAIVWNDLVFISGQGPMDPATNRLVEGDPTQQTRQVFANLDALLLASVYLAHIEDFQAMNAVYKGFFQGVTFPARTTIEAGALPLGISVEIDMMAYRVPSAG